ncbi:MarR family winged helix-turn-helix transcriptional regulator [Amycolatopsis sp. NPDC059090]|uniref:MarR family winged helix-turn-helix transcriptional regulator n=1 Tax=unclassified Amycolatopsis TaxID=2618356 RepID=UPI00366C8E88
MKSSETASLSQLINRASRALARDGDAALRPSGLRYAQVPVLASLSEGVALTQKELADASGIDQSSMAQLLARMDRDGLIRRTPHPHDARSRTITLAEECASRTAEARHQLAELDRRAVAGFTAEEIDSFRTLLIRVNENLEQP